MLMATQRLPPAPAGAAARRTRASSARHVAPWHAATAVRPPLRRASPLAVVSVDADAEVRTHARVAPGAAGTQVAPGSR
jgi:hypothetical protein